MNAANMNDAGLSMVNAVQNYGFYSDAVNESPNKLWRMYLSEHDKRYGSTRRPLSFKQWIEWAKEQELVKKYNVDAEAEKQKEEVKETERIEKVVNNTGRNIAFAITILAFVGMGFAFAKT